MTTNQRVFRKQLARIVALPFAVLLIAFAVLEGGVRQLTDAFRSVNRTDVVVSQARLVLRTIIDQESGLRGYLLTHDTRFLQQYQRVEGVLPKRFDELRTSVSDTPEQAARVDGIRATYDQWHEYAKQAMQALKRNDPVTSSVEFNLRGKELIDNLRRQQEEFVKAEDGLRKSRTDRSLDDTRLINGSAGVLAVMFALALLLETRRNLRMVDGEYTKVVANLNQHATELRESRERLEVTLRSIGDGVIVTDAAGRITFLNAVAENLTQSTNAGAQGHPLEEIFHTIHEATRVQAESPVRKVLRHDSVAGLSHQTILVRPDGSEIYIHDSGAPIRNDKGELLGIVVVFRDITQQRLTMDALRSNEKLAVAGRLSASIAHEIHNPLDVVMNLLYLLEQSASQEQAGLVELAQQELSRVGQITKSLLGLYRESKQPVPVKLAEIVDSVTVLLESRIREKSVHLVKHQSGEGTVMGFPAEIRQIVSNLVGNAIDAVGPGGTIDISVTDVRLRNGCSGARLCVSDDGGGISEQHMQQLFRPFFTTKGERGTGLGLWISQGLVEKHGGYIDVESSTAGNSGTSFRMYLPNSGAEQTLAASSFHA